MPNKKILLIEDDFETQFLFSECLKAENYDVVPFESGKQAISYLADHDAPDLIIMDLTFPDGTPEEFVSVLRGSDDKKDTPLVLVSGKDDLKSYASKFQAQGFLKKPFDIDPMIRLITSSFA